MLNEIQGQAGQGFEQPDVVKGVRAHRQEGGPGELQRCLQPKLLCDSVVGDLSGSPPAPAFLMW